MEQKFTPRRLTTMLTGRLFAAYAAYNVFVIIRDGSSLSAEAIFISAFVALLFGTLTGFVWSSDVIRPLSVMIRRTSFILVLIAVFALKLRMAGRVIDYVDSTKTYTVLYGGSYVLTMAGLVSLFIYFLFVSESIPLYPRASILLPISAILFFAGSFALEIMLFFGYNIGLEPSALRTIVIRPIFYLGFIGLSAFFLFPSQPAK